MESARPALAPPARTTTVPSARRVINWVKSSDAQQEFLVRAWAFTYLAAASTLTLGWVNRSRTSEIATESETVQHDSRASISAAVAAGSYVFLFLVAVWPALVLGENFVGAFNSPDETTRYVAAENFADYGHLYFDDEITRSDPRFASGPRGFAQHDGKSVPTYSQFPLLIYGLASGVFGSAAPLALSLLPGLVFLSLALLARILMPGMAAYVPWIFLGVTPLWYWASRVYFDVAVTFLFAVLALTVLVSAVQKGSRKRLFLGVAFLGIASLARIPEAPLLFMVGAAFMLGLGHALRAGAGEYVRLSAICAVSLALSFLVPLLFLNWWTNGSPTVISYTLLFAQNFPERLLPATTPWQEPLRVLQLALFPQPTSFGVLYSTFMYQVLFFIPFLFFVGMSGVLVGAASVLRRFGGYGVIVLALALTYMFVSRSDPGTFLAGQREPDLRVTLIRYWMPFYVLLGIGAAYIATRLPHHIAIPMVVAFAVAGFYGVWSTGPESVTNLQRTVETNNARFQDLYETFTEPNALVIAGSSYDKWTVPFRRTIGIWPGTATEDNLLALADTGADAVRRGQPTYFIFGPNEPREAPSLIADHLAPQFMGLTQVANPSFAGPLWKIISNPRPVDLAPGDLGTGGPTREFTATFRAPGNTMIVTIGNDGSARNVIANPSFETGIALWEGPTAQGPVETTSEFAAFGSSALRMELSPAPEVGTRVRRTHTIPVEPGESQLWNLRAHVQVDQLSNADVEMLVFVLDKDGKVLVKPTARLQNVTGNFQELVLQRNELPPSTASLAIQLSIVATAPSGSGVAYWDGVELVYGPALAVEYCDGDHNGCAWEGEPNASASSREGGIEFARFESGAYEALAGEALQTGDSVVFDSGQLVVHRASGTVENLAEPFPIAADDYIQVTVSAESLPVLMVEGP